MSLVDLAADPPPPEWGVTINHGAVDQLAEAWAGDAFPLPAFDYPGTPAVRDEAWWFDFVTLATSVLACLWPPEGDDMWHAELNGTWLDDAPGIFAVFTRVLRPGAPEEALELARFEQLSDADGAALFAGRGTLQQIPARVRLLREVAATIRTRWHGSVRNLVDEAERDGRRIAQLLTDTMPGFDDRPESAAGVLPFDKLAHLGAALMASGAGWGDAGFHNYDDFPVYPDYMLPRVLRHHGALIYSPELAEQIDTRQLIPADSPEEHALRWSTVYVGAALRRALHAHGNPVTAPALDYRLWSEAVLGPDAASFGEHHRTLTMRY